MSSARVVIRRRRHPARFLAGVFHTKTRAYVTFTANVNDDPGVVFIFDGAVVHIVLVRIEDGAKAVKITLIPESDSAGRLRRSARSPIRVRKIRGTAMKIVVIGGTGLIGSKLVHILQQRGHNVVSASPSLGVNTLTGEGLAKALAGAQVVVDVANAPSWEDQAVLTFFETSGRNLLAAEAAAGIGHHVALSVVGTERLLASAYFRAKMAQENLVKSSSIPYTIVRATQFFEFVGAIAQLATEGQSVRLPSALMQPVAADDVAAELAAMAVEKPLNSTIEFAGPEPIRMDELVRRFLQANHDDRHVATDVQAGYYGIKVNDQSLTPGQHPHLGQTRFENWLSSQSQSMAVAH
ncbi:MAG: NmrA family transcriptional regulator [Planctomycetaceae bacterium]|nr:NmrA family transcriptional regulator [Planctomycetaceae bacterium]